MADEPDDAEALEVVHAEQRARLAQCDALERTFLALPIKDTGGGPGLPYRLLIPSIPRQLWFLNRGPRPRLSDAEERRLRDQPTAADLEMLSRRPRALPRTDLLELSERMLEALEFHEVHDFLLVNRLNILVQGLREEVKNKAGQPSKQRAQAIAEAVGKHYYGLTGEAPNNKAFVTLLQTVYDILGFMRMDARETAGRERVSAKSQAKKVAASWEHIIAKPWHLIG
jgi:hypothetical protein